MNQILQTHYEATLAKHGPNYRGMDWPDEEDVNKRYRVMLDGRQGSSVLDLGCGIGGLYEVLYSWENYIGIDISPLMIAEAKKKYPEPLFECRDILKNPYPDNSFDYVIMNGLLTVKATMLQIQMVAFARAMIIAAFKTCRIGIAFNVMSEHVDWKRDDLFHWRFDDVARFLTKEVSPHFVFRNDYGLREYTVYVYKESQ